MIEETFDIDNLEWNDGYDANSNLWTCVMYVEFKRNSIVKSTEVFLSPVPF